MKKLIYIIPLILLLALLAACGAPEETTAAPEPALPASIWDGSVASGFAGGNGSGDDPYRIESADQLAYLASFVNEGNDCTGKYFALGCDIDLANIAWIPIGNGEHAFDGNFDGEGHTVLNLKFDDSVRYRDDDCLSDINDGAAIVGLCGLFGLCENVSIADINISNVLLDIKDEDAQEFLYIGALVAKLKSNIGCSINNVKVAGIEIFVPKTAAPFDATVSLMNLKIGGIIGGIDLKSSSKAELHKIQCDDSKIELEDGAAFNRIGALIGEVNAYDEASFFECSDFVSYMAVDFPYDSFFKLYKIGAFGSISCQSAKLSNAYSEIYAHSAGIEYGNGFEADVFPIACVSPVKRDENIYSQYEVENLFGCIKPVDERSYFSEPYCGSLILNSWAKLNVVAINNKGCDSLPDGHGFDTSIWDLSNPAKPILK